ncbi:aldehyde dehydrogenase [Capsulimonas corticalis]|uniref:Aldehyde dehydrogenase n=1 Tax=Capsulimonas corticalis TaxID=2219043 RepID=A0A402D285_9BACT|nr:SDR family NAD(P)-dependent oxidoreductase [Capsulimonas corticalis]BDI30168.1 aldehyde dehydrogenase [Capsulimonas corticalis]
MTATNNKRRAALVTGAGRGIGRAIAIMLAEEGYDVALTARGADELSQTAHECEAHGVRALALPADITDPAQLGRVVETCVREFRGLNVLVSNAGSFHWGAADTADPDDWDHLVDLNLKASMRVTRLALPHLLAAEDGAAVLFIASMAGRVAFGMNAAYVASKHGVVGFAGSVFKDVRERGVKVCAICPGLVETSITHDIGADHAKMIQPEDIAEAARYVLRSPSRVCPTEILLQPQRAPWAK